MFHTCDIFGESLVVSHSRVLVMRILLIAHTLEMMTTGERERERERERETAN